MNADILKYTVQRLETFLTEIEKQRCKEFPFAHSKEAIENLYVIFNREVSLIKKIQPDNDSQVIKLACTQAIKKIAMCSMRLGCILHSLDDHNAYEIYRPLWHLASGLLEPCTQAESRSTRLILYSEWSYNAIIYNEYIHLPGFLFVGLPAWEASNPLLIPLAGHEFGHALWNQRRLNKIVENKLSQKAFAIIRNNWTKYQELFDGIKLEDIKDTLFVYQILDSITYSLKQSEEVFCDCIGLFLFGKSYLHAFAYLLSPTLGNRRSYEYPSMLKRVQYLQQISLKMNILIPNNYDSNFDYTEFPSTLPRSIQLLLELSDEITSAIVDDIIALIYDYVKSIHNSEKSVQSILKDFSRMIPSEESTCLADIINAAWEAYCDENLWTTLDFVDKCKFLKELVLKTIELLEIKMIMGEKG